MRYQPDHAWVAAIVVVCLLAPTGWAAIWNVSTFSTLHTAASYAAPGDEIVIAAGQYHVTNSLYVTTPYLTFRGATGNRDDVVLYGNGMNVNSGTQSGFWAAADGIQLRDLTIRDFWFHGVQICGGPYADNVVISNVKTINIGERHIKGSANYGISDNVLIENLWMEQTEEFQPRPEVWFDPYDYIGGIDAMHINNWTIRGVVAVNIHGVTGDSRAAVFLWNGVSNVTIENCTSIRCGRGIAIGNYQDPGTDSHVSPWHAVGGIIRNNVIIRRGQTADWALELDNTKDFKVYHNTIYSDNAAYGRTVQIHDDPNRLTTNLDLRNNLIRGGIDDISSGNWSTAAVAAMGNIVDNIGTVITPSWFVNVAGNDLHLTSLATGAINHAPVLAEVTTDIDGQLRGTLPDYGADEYNFLTGDINADGYVNVGDLQILVATWGRTLGEPGYDGRSDLDGNNYVNVGDLQLLVANWGRSL